MKKYLLTIVTVIICCAVVGTTFAWLMDKTDSITNTFTVGNVDIELAEGADLDLKMVPGSTITKDPTVTVKSGSEACWLFVEITESDNFSNFMEYDLAVDDQNTAIWAELPNYNNVYYCEVAYSESDQVVDILKDNVVTVKGNVTKADMDEIVATDNNVNAPTLTFTAYAIQKENITSATDAWTKILAAYSANS